MRKNAIFVCYKTIIHQRLTFKFKQIMEKPYVIGIDVGGTNTVVGIVDKRGQILNSGSIKTAKHAEVEDYLDELTTLIEATTFGLDYETRFDEEVLKEEASKSEELAGFYKNCAGGDMEACDSLYWESPIDSDLELFATLCGGERTADDVSAQCVDVGR